MGFLLLVMLNRLQIYFMILRLNSLRLTVKSIPVKRVRVIFGRRICTMSWLLLTLIRFIFRMLLLVFISPWRGLIKTLSGTKSNFQGQCLDSIIFKFGFLYDFNKVFHPCLVNQLIKSH